MGRVKYCNLSGLIRACVDYLPALFTISWPSQHALPYALLTKLFVLPVSTLRFPVGTEGYASRYLLAGGEMEYLVEQEGLNLGANP